MTQGPGMDLVRNIFAIIDKAIYSLIPLVYDLIDKISKMSIFTNDDINSFASRIYVFLGVIMLFKVTFSLIQYLVNPDTLNDKTVGAGNLVKNIIITLFLIIIVPFGFDLLYQAQSAILNDKLISKLILGTEEDSANGFEMSIDSNSCGTSIISSPESDGDYIALVAFRPFFQTYDDISFDGEDSKATYCSSNSVSKLLQSNIYNATTDDKYVINYSIVISTAVGVLVLLLLLEFCFDVSMRCIKLGFLEIAAPIAIITYIDPKNSKNGAFTKWLKEVLGTWARLFIRLAILDFVIYFISVINNNLGTYTEDIWVMLFLIIGALMFAKKAVQLIEDIFGFKFDHSIKLNPFKKIEDQALGGKQILGVGAGVAGSIGGAVAGARAGLQVGAIGRGALLGAISGFNNGKGDLKNPFGTGMNKTYKELTGNDMVNLTPSRIIMGMSSKGKQSVKEMSDYSKVARGRLNDAHTRLNEISHYSAIHAEQIRNLKQNGLNFIDMDKLDESKAKAKTKIDELTAKEELKNLNYTQIQEKYDAMKKEYDEYKEYVDNYKPSLVDSRGNSIYSPEYLRKKSIVEDYENGKLVELKNNLDEAEKEYSSVHSELENTKVALRSIENYKKLKDEENDIRSQISSIEKEISTFSDEKKQREKFWHQDSSPKRSLEEAKKNNPVVKKEENK